MNRICAGRRLSFRRLGPKSFSSVRYVTHFNTTAGNVFSNPRAVPLGSEAHQESPAVKRIVLIVAASIWIFPASLCAAQAPLGWPEVIALLTKARTQATTCVEVLKSSTDKAALSSVRLTYGMAEGEMDGVIAGLTIALVEGGDPDRLPTVRTSLETSGKGLKEICDAAVKTITPDTKGVWEEVAKNAIEPLFKAISDGVGALWTRHVEKDKLELETKKTQLEAAKWPRFGDIAAQ
jgi:hypothetical protein